MRERRRRVLMTEGSDTKLRIIGRLNQLVSQHFLYVCVCGGQYTIVMVRLQHKSMTIIFHI
jgi:Flp pilus assembly protein protease CpaA